jgi:hypothetical protein
MRHDWAIARALGDVQRLLQANLPPKRRLPDDRTVACLRAVVSQDDVLCAMRRGSDTAPAFALRGMHRILHGRQHVPRAIISSLWEFMDEPALDELRRINRGGGATLERKLPRDF